MKTKLIITALAGALTITSAHAQVPISPSITTPDKVETRIGTLDFKDGAPSKETLAKVYDNLDFTHAFEAFVNTFQGVNLAAARKGMLDIGVKDNEVLLFSDADGCEVAVPDHQRGHRLFLRLHRLYQGPHGVRDAAQGAWHHRRHVVALGH